jgi:hypothetical protein
MKEQLVSFVVAKLAAQKGFPQHYSNVQFYHPHTKEIDKRVLGNSIAAPPQSVVQKWLRDTHEIHITVYHHKIRKFNAGIEDSYERHIDDSFDKFFRSYEAALEEALFKALNAI